MTMKNFIILSLLAALPLTKAAACASEGPTHNHYMFSVYRHNALTDGPAYLYDIDRYWQTYANQKASNGINFYRWNSDAVMDAAKSKGDTEMRHYLSLLNRYLKVCESYAHNSWNYPTKQQIAHNKNELAQIFNSVKVYRGTKLRPQYTLLKMRIFMMQGNDNANISQWNGIASKLPASPWREAMRNIYARALMKSGQRQRACDIYAEQGDVQSIRDMMKNYRNLNGIKSVYAQNPNAPTLEYLVQDFVNNVQETLDQGTADIDDGWYDIIDAKKINRRDAMDFVQFARNAANNKNVKSPSLWMAAASMTDYLLGNQQQAMSEADIAVKADGTQRMKDNARAIRLLVSTRSNKPSEEYSKYLTKEFNWLDTKIKEERGDNGEYANHYTDVKDRVVHKGLEPLYRSIGNSNAALAMCAMMATNDNDFNMAQENNNTDYYGGENINISYSSEIYNRLDSLKADQLADYYGYITNTNKDPFEKYCTQQTYRDKDYFNDLIGTKLIAEGRFADAIAYLEKVPMSLLGKQLISEYAVKRRYDIPRWFGKQVVDNTYEPVAVKRNIKLDFCRDMVVRLSRYNLSREGNDKQQQAYDLAVRYYQASCYGDCWFLTHYYRSITDSARSWEKDFAEETVKYLNVAKQSDNLNLRYHAVYALAFMPIEPWYTVSYDEKSYDLVYTICPQAAQYKALKELSMFATAYPKVIDNYTRHCDVLRKFNTTKTTADIRHK